MKSFGGVGAAVLKEQRLHFSLSWQWEQTVSAA
jgi:hypothetical protein